MAAVEREKATIIALEGSWGDSTRTLRVDYGGDEIELEVDQDLIGSAQRQPYSRQQFWKRLGYEAEALVRERQEAAG